MNGKGLAKAAALRWPTWDRFYRGLCQTGNVAPGTLHFFSLGGGQCVAALPTKNHWRYPSRLAWIETGLQNLAHHVAAQRDHRRSVAVPALGCGYGELAWSDVWPMMERILGPVERATFEIYAPHRPA